MNSPMQAQATAAAVAWISDIRKYAFHGVVGVTMPDATIFGFELDSGVRWYFLPISGELEPARETREQP